MSKLDLAVILAAIAGGTLLIEQGHRIVIEAPAAEDVESIAAACPDNDTMPYDARCLEYLKASAPPQPHLEVRVVLASPVTPAPCPDSDKQPYSASCLAFLKGATETGMRWRVIETPVPTSE